MTAKETNSNKSKQNNHRVPIDHTRNALLLESLTNLAGITNPETLWPEVVNQLKWLVDFERLDVVLLNDDRCTYRLQTLFEARVDIPLTVQEQISLERGILGLLLCQDETCMVLDLNQTNLTTTVIVDEWLEGGSLPSVMVMLLEAHGTKLGALVLGTKIKEGYRHTDVEIMRTFATHLSLALERFQQLEKLQHTTEALAREITERKKTEQHLFFDITERQRIEEQLREREQFLQNLTDHVPVMLWTALPDGTMDFVSQPWIDYTGMDLTMVRQQGWRELIHPEDFTETLERWLQASQTGQPYEMTHRVKQADGSYRWCISRAILTRNEQQVPLRWIGSAVDIDLQKQAEQALQKSEAFARLALSVGRFGTWRYDPNTNLVELDKQMRQIWGEPEDAVMLPLATAMERIHPDDRSRVVDAVSAALDPQSSGTYDIDYRIVWTNGTERWISANGQAQFEGEGEARRVIGLLGTALDFTERKQAEAALLANEAKLRGFVEANVVGILYGDIYGGIAAANDELLRIVGYTQEDLETGKLRWTDITPPEYLPLDEYHVAEAQAKGACTPYEKEYLRKDGSRVPVLIGYTLVGEVREESVAFILDLTERKQAEQILQERARELTQLNSALTRTTDILQERNQELDQFVYVVSHDLKAPLRAISNLSQWIEDDLGEQLPEENQQQMQLLRERVSRMERFIDGLLDYSRVNRIETAKETVDVKKLLEEIIDSLAPPEGFEIVITQPLPILNTQRLPLSQVFANLLSNALKHHGSSTGQVTISIKDLGNYYQFSVADDGQGIAPEHHERVFAIFQTLGKNENKMNTGIGLAIVKKIVERQGGKITLESEVGQGTTFRFTWPK